MSFVSGLLLIDAPASALNNLGSIPGSRTDNVVGVKVIRTKEGNYPYVSAQAFRYWLRETLTQSVPQWKAAPVYREEKIAYTDADPIKWWDDDLFGYMRAPSEKTSAKQKRASDASQASSTPLTKVVTRCSPFRVSTFVSLAPTDIVDDFGVMARHEGDPVPHEHQFYRAALKGLFSLNLKAAGTFWYREKTGFRNLDDHRAQEAKEMNLKEVEEGKAFRLPLSARVERITALFKGLAHLEGGAKQALHYTDVAPVVAILAVTKGGNNIFGHVIGTDARRLPIVNDGALKEALAVFRDDILSPAYIGWVRGFRDEEREKLETMAKEDPLLKVSHPRQAFQNFIEDLRRPENAAWLD